MLATYFPEELAFSANTQHSTAKVNGWCLTGQSPACLTGTKRVVIFFVEASSNQPKKRMDEMCFLIIARQVRFQLLQLAL